MLRPMSSRHLEPIEVTHSPYATHVRYRVVREPKDQRLHSGALTSASPLDERPHLGPRFTTGVDCGE